MSSRRSAGALAVFSLTIGSACSTPSEGRIRGIVTTRDTVGDTIYVRIAVDSAGVARVNAIEELSIGVFEGPEEFTFGRVSELAPDASGGVFVFDGQVPALRYYDADGNFARKLGGKGAGPGEYEDVALGLAIRSDGRLIMRDPRNGRLNVYNPDGSYSDSWVVASGLYTDWAMTLDMRDHIYLKILLGRPQPDEPWPVGLLHLNEVGEIVDTIPPPSIEGEPKGGGNGVFLTSKQWTFTRSAQIVVGVSDDYSFEIRSEDGPLVRVSKSWTPVELHPEEKEQLQASLDWQWERQGQFMTSEMEPVPRQKPAYQGLYAGLDGTIWVRLHVPSERRETVRDPDPDQPPPVNWVEPRVFDVFEPDGTYLGEVRVPPRTNILAFSLDKLWGVRVGEFDEQYVVRLGLGLGPPVVRLETKVRQ